MKRNRTSFKFGVFILIIFVIFNSCQKEKNDSDLKDEIFFELLKYQKENPLEKDSKKMFGEINFIYKVIILPPKFVNSADENTAVYITCSPSGIGNKLGQNYYGVYESDQLKKTFIIDESNQIKNLVKISKKTDLQNYIIKNPPIIDIIFPVKMFILRDNKLIYLNEIAGNNHRN